jgi:hypothetical protein
MIHARHILARPGVAGNDIFIDKFTLIPQKTRGYRSGAIRRLGRGRRSRRHG